MQEATVKGLGEIRDSANLKNKRFKCVLAYLPSGNRHQCLIAARISPESTHSGLMAWQLLGKNGAFAAKKAYILAIYPQLTPDKRKDF